MAVAPVLAEQRGVVGDVEVGVAGDAEDGALGDEDRRCEDGERHGEMCGDEVGAQPVDARLEGADTGHDRDTSINPTFRYSQEIRNCDSHHNASGYSGTDGNATHVDYNNFALLTDRETHSLSPIVFIRPPQAPIAEQ